MNTFLWILQGVLALAFLLAGLLKATSPKEKLAARMGWVKDFPPVQVKLIGGAETLGALGLVLPSLTGILTWLTPLAGAALSILMIGAIYTHIRRNEIKGTLPSLILGALACGVAAGRSFILPL
ncbi:MAG: DoxX family protein [Spirochaetota bacterium]